jgi:hypothetical protein
MRTQWSGRAPRGGSAARGGAKSPAWEPNDPAAGRGGDGARGRPRSWRRSGSWAEPQSSTPTISGRPADGSGRGRIVAQQDCGAGRHNQRREQTGGRLAAERDPGSRLGLSPSAGAVSGAAEQMREAFGEGATRAPGSVAAEASHGEVQSDDLAAGGQVSAPSLRAAMESRAGHPTSGAARLRAFTFCGEGESVAAVTCHAERAASGKMAEQGHARIGTGIDQRLALTLPDPANSPMNPLRP